jgi:hypothetical protein
MLSRALLLLSLLLVAWPAFAQPVAGPVTYRLDPRRSWVYVVVRNDPAGLASGARGTFRARATDFGFKPYSNFGVLKNEDEMEFVVDVVGVPAS